MNVCLLGDGLISLTLAKTLINNKIKVFMYYKHDKKPSKQTRTIGISSDNLDFLQKRVIKIKKKEFWEINKIEIYNDKNKEKRMLDFKNSNKKLFSVFKNNDLYKLLEKSLKKNNYFKKIKISNKFSYNKVINNHKFNLIINCDANNEISKKYFYKKFLKNYQSTAYASIINHNISSNKKAIQIFTEYGPLAFLPISKTQTSIVFSIKNKRMKNHLKLSKEEFKKLIIKNNKEYKINSINTLETFKLNLKILRNYYYKNILAFGDILHQIHPLSGQGFNMTLRDIKVLIDLIKEKENLGLPINSSVYQEFENKTKHLNLLFAYGNDFIYEFFNYDNYYLNFFSKKILNYFNNNKLLNNLAIKCADKGLII
tara:strand:- start:823 stop:1932 length:1110 start_codon:yes stop_codon:yes gene_type:complete